MFDNKNCTVLNSVKEWLPVSTNFRRSTMDQIREMRPEKMKKEDVLLLANVWLALLSGYTYRLDVMHKGHHYWLSDEFVNTSIEIMNRHVSLHLYAQHFQSDFDVFKYFTSSTI